MDLFIKNYHIYIVMATACFRIDEIFGGNSNSYCINAKGLERKDMIRKDIIKRKIEIERYGERLEGIKYVDSTNIVKRITKSLKKRETLINIENKLKEEENKLKEIEEKLKEIEKNNEELYISLLELEREV